MEFKVSRSTVILALVSFGIGFVVNYYSTKLANNQLKKELLAELAALNTVQQTGRIGLEESVRIAQRKNEIEAQIKILS